MGPPGGPGGVRAPVLQVAIPCPVMAPLPQTARFSPTRTLQGLCHTCVRRGISAARGQPRTAGPRPPLGGRDRVNDQAAGAPAGGGRAVGREALSL